MASSSFDSLLEALSACEESQNQEGLEAWVKQHNEGVNADVWVTTTPADNRGSPLLIACELGLPRACRALIQMGADINYRHPSDHGNTPLLRCTEMGYTECLEELLSAPNLDMRQVTREYKLVLGQNIPQYEAGGRSALMLAVEASRVESVELLLKHEQSEFLLELKDSFGRSPLEAAFERLALVGERKQDDQERICEKLCAALELSYDHTKAKLQPTKEMAQANERDRNVTLRARYIRNANAKKEAERARGLQAVEKKYEKLHPHVYATTFPADVLLLDAEHSQLSEPLPGTFAFHLLSKTFCRELYEELLHYEQSALQHPDLPLHVRHDGNFGSLQDCGFQPVLRAVEAVFQPLVKRWMSEKGVCQVYHAFLTRNWVGRDENFRIHCDKSDLTFNICLQASDDLEGSTVGFYSRKEEQPTEDHRVYTHVHQVGHAIMHDGRQWHKTDSITRGTRASLIAWARLVGSECRLCGAFTGVTWKFCKKCGEEV